MALLIQGKGEEKGFDAARGRRAGVPFSLHVPRRRPAAATSSFTYDQRHPTRRSRIRGAPQKALRRSVCPQAEPRRGREAFARK